MIGRRLLGSGGRCHYARSSCSQILLFLVASTMNVDRLAALARWFALVTFDSTTTAAQTACATPLAPRESARHRPRCLAQAPSSTVEFRMSLTTTSFGQGAEHTCRSAWSAWRKSGGHSGASSIVETIPHLATAPHQSSTLHGGNGSIQVVTGLDRICVILYIYPQQHTYRTKVNPMPHTIELDSKRIKGLDSSSGSALRTLWVHSRHNSAIGDVEIIPYTFSTNVCDASVSTLMEYHDGAV